MHESQRVTKNLYYLLLVLVLLTSKPLLAAETATGPHIRVSLISEDAAVTPGKTHWVGILLEPEHLWHTYWRNPGDSGEPTKVAFKTEKGIEIGDLQWPIPQQIPVAHLVNYGYEGATLLMAPLTLESGFSRNQLTIEAELSWLVCKEDCIPGSASLNLTLPVSDNLKKTVYADTFAATRERLPDEETLYGSHGITTQHINLIYSAPYEAGWSVLPLSADIIHHNKPQVSNLIDGQLTHTMMLSDYFEASKEPLLFLLTDGKKGYYLISTPMLIGGEKIERPDHSLLLLALMAFVGGLILNLMPCVLPILSIKALSIQQDTSRKTGKLGYFGYLGYLGYPLGVLLSFNAFAVLILLLRHSGEMVGWGFHLQEPWVVALLAFLFLFIALQLMDIAPTGERLMGLGQGLTAGNGFASQFFTGVLAVVVASPCTAPFMAAALGVALVSNALVSFTLFTSLAIGFALPMTLIFSLPKVHQLLPKPGAWMQTFRQFLVFPMLATVVWLLWVYQSQVGTTAKFVLLTNLLLFALLLWLSARMSGFKAKVIMLLALLTLVPGMLQQTTSAGPDDRTQPTAFTESRLQQLRDDNQVVLVNITADWCITCKVNERVAFRSEDLNALFEEQKVHYLVGDWTNKTQKILQFLNRYQRSGVPLYVVYAGNKYERVLPQLLTPQIVINAINKAKQELTHED